MNQAKYRFNRKDGKVYRDREKELTAIGNNFRMIVLWASEPIYGKPFEHLIAQNWVQLTFMDEQGNWCYGILGNGTTNALSPWLEYCNKLESESIELLEVITSIGFEPIDSQHQWFDYTFSGVRGKPGLGDRMRALIQISEFPLIEPLGLIK